MLILFSHSIRTTAPRRFAFIIDYSTDVVFLCRENGGKEIEPGQRYELNSIPGGHRPKHHGLPDSEFLLANTTARAYFEP
jgi:hypothetical protein